MAHTNGMESFWSMLKRAHIGTFHKLSPKHLDRYVQEFAGKHNMRNSGTLAQMRNDGRSACRPEPALPGAGSPKRSQFGCAVGVAASEAHAPASQA